MPLLVLALSGGVDSSVAGALALKNHPELESVGVTLGLWGGERHGNSCSTADATAATEVAKRLGVTHEYLDWTDEFERLVVGKFTEYAKRGGAANPCIDCNKTFKAERLFAWATARGAEKVVTGHYARVVDTPWGLRVGRGRQVEKDQSYVLCGFEPEHLEKLELPVGELPKDQTRKIAAELELGTAEKRDSMGLCFSPQKVLQKEGMPMLTVRDERGVVVGSVQAGQVVLGQRKLGIGGFSEPRYVTDISENGVTVGARDSLLCERTPVKGWRWVGGVAVTGLQFQVAAHGAAHGGELRDGSVWWEEPQGKVTPGQVVVGYKTICVGGEEVDVVVGYGEATWEPSASSADWTLVEDFV